jgi:cytochrome c-type biogenesis protein CcmE
VNKRARIRLIGVTAIVLIGVGAILLGAGSKDGAYYRQVSEIVADESIQGERIQVGGEVVAGSWDQQSNPMKFEIREEGIEDGETIQVVYSGGVPSTFGDGVVAILKGTVNDQGVLESDDMITKCPSKYESAAGALTVAALVEKGDDMVDKYTKVTGVVVADTIVPPGEETRFLIVSEEGTEELGIAFEGALPAGMDTDSVVVVSGKLGESGVFVADSVSLSEEAE